jgi:hypothetical protein
MASWITNAQNYISSNTMKNPIDEIFGSKARQNGTAPTITQEPIVTDGKKIISDVGNKINDFGKDMTPFLVGIILLVLFFMFDGIRR